MTIRAQNASIVFLWIAILLGCVCVIVSLWDDAFKPLAMCGLNFLVVPFSFPGFFAALIALIGLAFLLLVFIRKNERFAAMKTRPITSLGLGVVAMTHAVVIASCVQFLFVSPGSQIRPMGWTVTLFLGSGLLFVFLMVLGLVFLFSKEKASWLWIVIMVGGVFPLPIGIFLLRLISWVVGFRLSD